MELRLEGPTELEVAKLAEPDLEIVGDADGEGFGPLQMFAASIALCTASVLHGYAHQVLKVGVSSLSIRVCWSYGERPYRVDRMEMRIRWPEVPEDRVKAAERAAATCTIHRTLEHPPELVTTVSTR
jgi:uncharacterized OsmC-like protein